MLLLLLRSQPLRTNCLGGAIDVLSFVNSFNLRMMKVFVGCRGGEQDVRKSVSLLVFLVFIKMPHE